MGGLGASRSDSQPNLIQHKLFLFLYLSLEQPGPVSVGEVFCTIPCETPWKPNIWGVTCLFYPVIFSQTLSLTHPPRQTRTLPLTGVVQLYQGGNEPVPFDSLWVPLSSDHSLPQQTPIPNGPLVTSDLSLGKGKAGDFQDTLSPREGESKTKGIQLGNGTEGATSRPRGRD